MSTIEKDKRPSVKEITASLNTSTESKSSNSRQERNENNEQGGNGIKKLLSLWRTIENQGEKEAKETQMYNERKLRQSGRQYSYLSNSSRKNFTYMNLSESTKRQAGIGTSGRRYDRFGNLVTTSNDGAQKSTQLSTNVKVREPPESPLTKKEELPKEEEEKVIVVAHKDLDDEEVPIEVEKKKKSKEGHKKHKHKVHISDEDEEIEIKEEKNEEVKVKEDKDDDEIEVKVEKEEKNEENEVEDEKEKKNEEIEVGIEIEKEETQIEINEKDDEAEEEKPIQLTETEEEDEEKHIPPTEIELDEEKHIPPTETEAEEEKPVQLTEIEEDEEKLIQSTENEAEEEKPIPPTEIEDETQDEHKSDSEEKKKKKKRKEKKSANLDEVQEEKGSNDEEKKKKHKKKRSTSISVEAAIAEQEPPTFTPEIEDETAEKESHKKSKKRRSRSRSCGKPEEKEEEEREKEEKEAKDEGEKEEELPLVLEEVITTEEAKDEDKKKRRRHSKTKNRDESDGHHHHKKRSSSLSKEKEVGDGDDGGEKEEGSEEKDKKRKKRKSATTIHENTRKLSLGDGDEKTATGSTGNTNESWKKKKAWATLGANDVNKPFGEMTPDDKALMREKYETEIVETESDYIDKLKLIKELYMTPLVALTKTGNEKSAIITTAQISHIFSNLDIILNYNTILYKQMREWKEKVDEEKAAAAAATSASSKKKKKDKSPVRRDSEGGCPRAKSLGTIFLTLTDFLKTYISYCNNYPRALETISELKEKNKRFVDFINECQRNERSESLNLNMLIIMPIQRIPRYVLLLKDVLKYTPEDDPDYEKLTRALDKMRAVADDLNKKKKDAEDRDLLRHIDKKLVFNSNGNYGNFDSLLSVQSRRYIGEGDGTVICSTVEKGKPKGMHIFLFNDIVCFTKPSISGGKYKVIELFKIIDSEITMPSPAEARKEIPALPAAVSSALPVEELICFSSVDGEEDGSSIKPFAFYAEDGATTKKWFNDLVSNQEIIRKSAQTFKDAVVRASITPTLPQKITLN